MKNTPDHRPIPTAWLPDAPMTRIITHWTAGGYQASAHDKLSYHFLIEGDGGLVRGRFSVLDNVGELIWDPRQYAAHARAANSNCIGISVCCMQDAIEEPFDGGPYPMKKVQWDRLVASVAQLCDRYDIEITPNSVLGHGEVQETLGLSQDGKWDPLALPWDPNVSKQDVGDQFRKSVRMILAGIS